MPAAPCNQEAFIRTGCLERNVNEAEGRLARYLASKYRPLPAKGVPRDRWLTRPEAAKLLKVARKTRNLARFIVLGLYTGSRSGVILSLKWEQIDLKAGVMRRTALGARTSDKKRAPPVRLGRRILTHLRRWERDGEPFLCHYQGARVKSLKSVQI